MSLTEGVCNSDPAAASGEPPAPPGLPPARDPRAERRGDLRAARVVLLGLVLAGIAAGVVWWWLAPRGDFEVVEGGAVALGDPDPERLVAGDAVFVLVLAVLGALVGAAGWLLLRRRRGVVMLAVLAGGMLAASVIAWRVGVLLAPGPSEAELADVGATVTAGLSLGGFAPLAVGPFLAVLAYLVGAVVAADDLGRRELSSG